MASKLEHPGICGVHDAGVANGIPNMAMQLVVKPHLYDGVVTTNLFGDILSDEGAQLVGGLGVTPGANIGETYGMFEPVHGSAPKYAGKDVVNPTAMILATKLMFDWLGDTESSRRLEAAIAAVIRDHKVGTYDVGGSSTTLEVAQEVVRNVTAGAPA